MRTFYIYIGLTTFSIAILIFLSQYKTKEIKPFLLEDTPKEINAELVMDKIKVNQPNVAFKSYDFSYIIRKGSKRWRKLQDGTYQNSKYDIGNINYKGEFVGTNRSIAAKTYTDFTGKKATIYRMKNISYKLAYDIYRDIWRKHMKGHKMKVHNPILLDMVFNAICSSYGSQHFREVLEEMTGHRTKVNWITDEDVEIFNNLCENPLREAKFYKRYWEVRNNYYNLKSKKRGHRGLSKWIKDYDVNAYDNVLKLNKKE